MRTSPIGLNESDCMISTMTEIENETGGSRTYSDFFNQVSNNYSSKGVTMSVGEYQNLLQENFYTTNITHESYKLFDPVYMQEVMNSGNVITVQFRNPGHADNVRALKVFYFSNI